LPSSCCRGAGVIGPTRWAAFLTPERRARRSRHRKRLTARWKHHVRCRARPATRNAAWTPLLTFTTTHCGRT